MITLTIDEEGNARCIYDDVLADYLAESNATIKRASHVEPGPGGWTVDLSPFTGYELFLGPFHLRQDALDAEVEWLREHL